MTAHPPGYIPQSAPNVAAFRAYGDARNCTTYDQWPYGLRNHTGYAAKQTDDQLRRQLAARPTTYLVGELDILPLAGFDGSCAAMAQGPTRLARGEAFGRFVNEKLSAHHIVAIVPLCGHNARCMYTSEVALPLLFAKHEGCLVASDEGFEDAVTAFPNARAMAVPEAPSVSSDFAQALRAFCDELAQVRV